MGKIELWYDADRRDSSLWRKVAGVLLLVQGVPLTLLAIGDFVFLWSQEGLVVDSVSAVTAAMVLCGSLILGMVDIACGSYIIKGSRIATAIAVRVIGIYILLTCCFLGWDIWDVNTWKIAHEEPLGYAGYIIEGLVIVILVTTECVLLRVKKEDAGKRANKGVRD